MTDFRNAYHFVQRAAAMGGQHLPKSQKDYGLHTHAVADGHAIYAPGPHSGRITCRITLECPTVIGAKRVSGEGLQTYSIVHPFLFKNRPALPATSLKGVISSVAESVSRAPYRVLDDAKLTLSYSEKKNNAWVVYRYYEGHAVSGQQLDRVHDHVDPASRPLMVHKPGKAKRPTRSQINPVEAMFGFVREAERGGTIPKGAVVSAAGKLRFSHALPSDVWATRGIADYFVQGDFVQGDHPATIPGLPDNTRLVRLKEQGEPMKKPRRAPKHGATPSYYSELRSATPNFYFLHSTNPDQFIAKKAFATNPGNYTVQGGKFYLHHPDTASEPWRTADTRTKHDDLKRKAAVAPLNAGVTFDFHIDFDNLSDHELNILCYSLRPSLRFRHKIGLGKGLGLGSIRIDILDLVTVDRAARYTAEALLDEDPRHDVARAPEPDRATAHIAAHDAWLTTNDPGARRNLLAIGETHRFDAEGQAETAVPVLWVPLTEAKFQSAQAPAGAMDAEKDSFKWFFQNDKPGGWRQKLHPVGQDGRLPVLSTDGTAPVARPGVRAPSPTAPATPTTPRGTALGPDERAGKVSFVATDKHGLYAFLIPDGGGKDVWAGDCACRDATLRVGQNKGALVAFVLGADGITASRIRLM